MQDFATRANAQAFLQVQEEFGSFDAYLWSFVDGKTIVNDVQLLAGSSKDSSF